MENIELDGLYEKAKIIVLNDRNSSTSYLQRKLEISWNRANIIIEQLEKMNILQKPNKNGLRKIVVKYKAKKRTFTEEEKINEAFLRIANVLYSHWRICNDEEKESLQCGGHSRLFDYLIPDSYITKGESKNGKGHREHIVPCALIRCHAYSMFNDSYLIEDVANMIKDNLIIVHITKEEQNRLDYELGYKHTMPENWEFGHDPYKRLEMGDIEVVFYKKG